MLRMNKDKEKGKNDVRVQEKNGTREIMVNGKTKQLPIYILTTEHK